MAEAAAKQMGRPRLAEGARRRARVIARLDDEEELRLLRLSEERGEGDSDLVRAGLRALEREPVVLRILELLRTPDPKAAVRRVQELLDREAEAAARRRAA